MVQNLGSKWSKWSRLKGPGVVIFFTCDYYILIDTSEQLMSQRYRIVPPGVSSSDALQAYSSVPIFNLIDQVFCKLYRFLFFNLK